MKFLELVDYEATQHYKDRTPPWIKLHREILNKREFLKLTEAERYHFIALQILASECLNRIPIDSKWLRGRLGITSEPAIKSIVRAGLARVVTTSGNGHSIKTMSLSNPEECFAAVVDHHNQYSSDIAGGWIYGTPELPAALLAAVRHIGGWERIDNLRKNAKDLPFARREFIEGMKGGKK